MGSKTKKQKSRNFATILYSDSCPDFVTPISEEKVYYAISPLHNLDLKDSETGELKKEHVHVFFSFSGPTTVEHATELVRRIGGVGCEIVRDKKAYIRYLVHIDSPDKHQYSKDDIITNFDISPYFSDPDSICFELTNQIIENDISNFSELVILNKGNKPALRWISTHAYYLNILINDYKNQKKERFL